MKDLKIKRLVESNSLLTVDHFAESFTSSHGIAFRKMIAEKYIALNDFHLFHTLQKFLLVTKLNSKKKLKKLKPKVAFKFFISKPLTFQANGIKKTTCEMERNYR